jgi:predicted ATPase
MTDPTFLTRVKIKNYKSIGGCDVALGPLTFLVGPNGAGKSNFLDALRFVSDALNTTVDHALRNRGGVDEVRRRTAKDSSFGMRLEFSVPDVLEGHWAVLVEARSFGGFEVKAEECVVRQASKAPVSYLVHEGKVEAWLEGLELGEHVILPRLERLYLMVASIHPAMRTVSHELSRMRFYNLDSEHIRDFQPPDSGLVLARKGTNLASVVRRLVEADPSSMERIEEYLGAAVPGIRRVRYTSFAGREAVDFLQQLDPKERPVHFFAGNMSDGTLRLLGLLVALFQGRGDAGDRLSLIGIEEPETALHPFALGVLVDALREASERTQVIITSHSSDLLDNKEIGADSLLSVTADDGATKVGSVSEADRSVIRDRLFTPGELLRADQLVPDANSSVEREVRLFDNLSM